MSKKRVQRCQNDKHQLTKDGLRAWDFILSV